MGFAKEADKKRTDSVAEAGGGQKKHKGCLQFQADRLRQQAGSIHARILREIKEKHKQFQALRKQADRDHEERMVIPSTQWPGALCALLVTCGGCIILILH